MPETGSGKLMAGIRSKDLSCKTKLGYPRLFDSLSQQWAKAVLSNEGNGMECLHSPKQAAMWSQTVWPLLPRKQQEKDQPNKQDDALITSLWNQLAKVDYFSPLLWRVDVYGNVLYRFADAGTPLSWSVDHLFPVARGGLSHQPNLRIVQSQAHINKADSLEFLLTRDMVCTGLSMLDFKVTVKHSLEDLLTRYGKQATALPIQATPPRGTVLEKQHKSRPKSMPHMPVAPHSGSVAAYRSSAHVPLGLKATRVAHAAAQQGSQRYSPSMRSPLSGQFQTPGLAPGQMLDNTVGFVQRQGSFHSDHAIQHLMTDHPFTDPSPQTLRKNASHKSLPSQRSLHHHHSVKSLPGGALTCQDLSELPQWSVHHGRDSAHSMHHNSSEPRQSFQTESSDGLIKRSATMRPASMSSRLSVQSQPVVSDTHQKPPLAHKQNIASSALFHSTPVSQHSGLAASGHYPQGYSDHAGHHHLPFRDNSFASQHEGYGSPQYSNHGQLVAPQDSFGQATVTDYRDGFAQQEAQMHDTFRRRQQQQQQQQHQQQQFVHAADADAVLNSDLQSADSFGSEMLTTDINQTQHWGKSMLDRMPQVSEEPEQAHSVFEQDHSATATAAAAMPSSALQSADSFGDEMLTTDLNQTQHWGRTMLDQMPQVPEAHDAEEDVGSSASKPATPAVHAVPAVPLTMTAEGIHPPVRQREDGPHDWLWLPDELSTVNDSPLSSAEGSRPDIHAWLSQQQSSRLAKQAQRASLEFKGEQGWQPAVSPTSPLNTADSMNSTFDDHQIKPYTSLGWTQDPLPLLPDNVFIPPAVATHPISNYSSAPQLSRTDLPQPEFQTVTQSQTESPAQSESPSRSWSPAAATAPMPQETVQASPFARWSSTPILGPKLPPSAPLSNSNPQHAQQPQQVLVEAVSQPAQAEAEEVHAPVPAADAKQQELSDRLAALDSLGSLDAAEAFEAFGSPVPVTQPPTDDLPGSSSLQAEHEASAESLYDTLAPLPVHVPGASLSAPEEALLATMQEILNDAAGYTQDEIRRAPSSSLATSDSLSFPTKPSPAPAICVNDDITFPLTPTATATIPRAASNSPEGFSPTTPDQLPSSLPACQVNPIGSFRSVLSTQERQPKIDAVGSFHQLLMSQELSKQERLSKFHQLLASQEMKKEGAPLASLAGRVNNMAAQLDALQKRTQELQAASSPSRRVNSPFKNRASPLRGADARRSPSSSPRAAAISPQPEALANNSAQPAAAASNSPQLRATASNSPSPQAASGFSPAGHSRGVSQVSGEAEASPRSLTSRIARISQRFEQPAAEN